MLTEAHGDLFNSRADALVNAVNCIGVMGAGIAWQFRQRFSSRDYDYYAAYRTACEKDTIRIGTVNVFATGAEQPRFILSFPTKKHWDEPSALDHIRKGLPDLRRVIIIYGIRSVAIPALGCGLGGLDWGDVKPLIANALSELENVDIRLYAPAT